jgi:hypothetical protein
VVVDCDVIQPTAAPAPPHPCPVALGLRSTNCGPPNADRGPDPHLAAVGGIYEGTPVLDLDYVEDSSAHSTALCD